MSAELERLATACIFPGFPGTDEPPDWLRRELQSGLGGVVLFAWNVEGRERLRRLTDALRAERPEVVVCVDEEGGDVTRLDVDGGSPYPGNLALGAVDDVALTQEVARAMGADLRAVGVDLDLAPVADVNTNPANPIVGVRAFGGAPELVSRHVAAFVTGLQAAGVAACAKHYPGHGDTSEDSHLGLPTVGATLESLRRVELQPFRAAIAAGVHAIMTAHIRVEAVDDAPATISRLLLHDLLRGELGFAGLVITDALEMRAISATVGVTEGAVLALAAGADALCLGHDLAGEDVAAVRAALVAAVRSDRLPEERLAEAADRVGAVLAGLAPGPPHGGPGIGAEAARRAIRVEGDVMLAAPALVVELTPEPTMAAGEAGRGLGELLRERAPATEVLRVDESVAGSVTSLAANGRQVILVLRDAGRHPWQQRAADALLATLVRPIVVDVGMPAGRPPAARGYLASYGSGRANLVAAVERLLGERAGAARAPERSNAEISGRRR